MTFI
ncbi:Protein CBG25842 [Caenorhabditis briggsae]|jgi:hypothetical protein